MHAQPSMLRQRHDETPETTQLNLIFFCLFELCTEIYTLRPNNNGSRRKVRVAYLIERVKFWHQMALTEEMSPAIESVWFATHTLSLLLRRGQLINRKRSEKSEMRRKTKMERKRARGTMGRARKTSFPSSPFPSFPALLVISLSPVPYLSPLEREGGLCERERLSPASG